MCVHLCEPLRRVFYAAALALIGLFLAFLLLAPRQPAFTTPDDEARLTSNYVLGIALMAVLSFLGAIGGLAGCFIYGFTDKVHAMVIEDDMGAYG
jgi:hypothetical protein